MSEVFFYHLERRSLEEVLPQLLERTLEREWRAVIQAGSEARVEELDKLLWTWREDGFLPHARAGDARFAAHAAMQPIWMTAQDDTPNAAEVLFLVDGVRRDELDGFVRCVVIFDGRDEASLADARAFWKILKQANHDLTYWQQSSKGKWEKRG